MSRFNGTLRLLVPLAIVAPCLGWGREGHHIVGAIATKHLSPEARAAVVELLGNDDLGTAGCWADDIRTDPRYDWAKPLHYLNVPRDASSVDVARDCVPAPVSAGAQGAGDPAGAGGADRARVAGGAGGPGGSNGASGAPPAATAESIHAPDPATTSCVLQAIETYSALARDRSQPAEVRAAALRFLVHFVGDVHQPLHVSYADDRGGNNTKLTAFGHPFMNLHAVWDATILEHRTHGDWSALADEIDQATTPTQRSDWQASVAPIDWANESLTITRRIYRELPPNGILGEVYYDRNIGIVLDRLAAGGVRLAALLNRLFATPAPDGAASRPAVGTPPDR
ncbi:MAG: S1/P1 nuclease [Phycisphaerales bacterium]